MANVWRDSPDLAVHAHQPDSTWDTCTHKLTAFFWRTFVSSAESSKSESAESAGSAKADVSNADGAPAIEGQLHSLVCPHTRLELGAERMREKIIINHNIIDPDDDDASQAVT